MQQVTQNIRSGELSVQTLPEPLAGPGEVLIANAASVVSAGTEKSVMDLAKKSLIGKARERPDHVRRVVQKMRQEGVFETIRQVQAKLSEPSFAVVAAHLNWLVLRGSYAERAVIFNVDDLFGPLVRALKALARTLTDARPAVTAAYAYLDERGSDYYLESRRPGRSLDFKKLFGPETLRVRHGDLSLGFHPTSFSQINESAVPVLLELAGELLAPSRGERLIDLYCGYGLFSLALAGRVRDVIGVDAAGASVAAAKDNARRLRRGATRFLARRIAAETVEQLPAAGPDEIVLLDPPRDGVERGVIEALAARGPRGVLHVFCGVDEIPDALAAWQEGGYGVRRVAPVDLFPGTPHLEVLVYLDRSDGPA